MDYSKVVTKEDVELETLKKFLKNKHFVFDKNLIDKHKIEPTDLRYKGINYQITEGDKVAVQSRRQPNSKGVPFFSVRNANNIAELLLKDTLKKKSTRSDTSTVLLVDVMSNGGRDWTDLEKEVSAWAKNNLSLCNCWKEIYLVYRGKNIKLSL